MMDKKDAPVPDKKITYYLTRPKAVKRPKAKTNSRKAATHSKGESDPRKATIQPQKRKVKINSHRKLIYNQINCKTEIHKVIERYIAKGDTETRQKIINKITDRIHNIVNKYRKEEQINNFKKRPTIKAQREDLENLAGTIDELLRRLSYQHQPIDMIDDLNRHHKTHNDQNWTKEINLIIPHLQNLHQTLCYAELPSKKILGKYGKGVRDNYLLPNLRSVYNKMLTPYNMKAIANNLQKKNYQRTAETRTIEQNNFAVSQLTVSDFIEEICSIYEILLPEDLPALLRHLQN